jgi:glycosyltransferase involved in cell wall biosynthesis
MKIGIDVRCFAQGKNTGIEEYVKKTLEAIFVVDNVNEYILFFNTWKKSSVDFGWATKYNNVSVKKYSIPNKLLNISLWFLSYPKLDKLCGNVDIFFMPNSNFYAFSKNVQLFLTVHDLSFKHYKHAFSYKRRIWHFLVNPRLLMKKADHIFTVSEATKEDIYQTYNIKKQNITVAPNGITSVKGTCDRNDIAIIKVKEKYKLPYKFILYFGTIEPRKNIVNVIKAYDELRIKNKENIKHKLVIAGSNGWKVEEIEKVIENAKYKKDIIIIKNVPEKDKELIYTLASMFVYPSFFEGFGFPPLEAVACNIPVVISHTTSLPEVVGECAIMVDPMQADEMQIAMEYIILDRKLQFILKEKMLDYSYKFTWEQMANAFCDKIA